MDDEAFTALLSAVMIQFERMGRLFETDHFKGKPRFMLKTNEFVKFAQIIVNRIQTTQQVAAAA